VLAVVAEHPGQDLRRSRVQGAPWHTCALGAAAGARRCARVGAAPHAALPCQGPAGRARLRPGGGEPGGALGGPPGLLQHTSLLITEQPAGAQCGRLGRLRLSWPKRPFSWAVQPVPAGARPRSRGRACVSLAQPGANMGRSGRSTRREVSVSVSFGRPSRFSQPMLRAPAQPLAGCGGASRGPRSQVTEKVLEGTRAGKCTRAAAQRRRCMDPYLLDGGSAWCAQGEPRARRSRRATPTGKRGEPPGRSARAPGLSGRAEALGVQHLQRREGAVVGRLRAAARRGVHHLRGRHGVRRHRRGRRPGSGRRGARAGMRRGAPPTVSPSVTRTAPLAWRPTSPVSSVSCARPPRRESQRADDRTRRHGKISAPQARPLRARLAERSAPGAPAGRPRLP